MSTYIRLIIAPGAQAADQAPTRTHHSTTRERHIMQRTLDLGRCGVLIRTSVVQCKVEAAQRYLRGVPGAANRVKVRLAKPVALPDRADW